MRLNERSRILVELPMLLFLRIAGGDGGMTAREMETFDGLLANRDWCGSSLIAKALERTAREKAALWRQYVSGEFRPTIDRAAADLDTVFSTARPEERNAIERDLVVFCAALVKAAGAGAGLFSTDMKADRERAALIELIKRPSARIKAQSETKAAAAKSPVSSDAAPISVDDLWRGGKVRLRCLHVVDETADVKTFHFRAEPPRVFRYRPGQFLTFEFPFEGRTLRRSYSISSSPSRPYTVAITVKRVEGGVISNWLHDNLRPGDELFADGPNGKFTYAGEDRSPLLLISGGSGVTPLMSMTRWLYDTAPDSDVDFLHFARTPKDLIFERELRLIEGHMPNFRCRFVCSRTQPEDGFDGPTGRISADLLKTMVPDYANRRIMLCGPVPFMATAQDILKSVNFDMSRFAQESFGGAPRAARPLAEKSSTSVKVRFAVSKVEAQCAASDYLLDVALEKGIEVSFSCRAGQCGSCKTSVLEGAPEHDHADALGADDVESGRILLCQARPQGDVTLDL
jgi:ferredoxin-NADP reductase